MKMRFLKWVAAVAFAIGGPLAHAGTVTYVYTDPQGTPLAEANASGTITATFDYSPYGRRVLGNPTPGPGYTGHVEDPDTGFVYMQARYYDPVVGRFLSLDPVGPGPGDLFNLGRYDYASNNPVMQVDPDGRAAQLLWTAPDKVAYTVTYVIGESNGARLPITTAQIDAAVRQNFSGTVNLNGVAVTVTARAMEASGSSAKGTSNFISVVPDTRGVTSTGRAETNAIGGNRITVAGTGPFRLTPNMAAHELGGHAGGAGDQYGPHNGYSGGLGVDGKVLQQDAPGASGVMFNLSGPANQQTLREILQAPTNTNTCAAGVSAANGACGK